MMGNSFLSGREKIGFVATENDRVLLFFTRNLNRNQRELGSIAFVREPVLSCAQGYRVDYTAAADALTFAPETFNEFFTQRRRWMTSTLTNIIDLLSDYKNTVLANDNISYIYMLYQVRPAENSLSGLSMLIKLLFSVLMFLQRTWCCCSFSRPSGTLSLKFLCRGFCPTF